MNSFWEITKRQLEEARSTIRNKEREVEDSEERHQVEIKVSAGHGTVQPLPLQYGAFQPQCTRLEARKVILYDLQSGQEQINHRCAYQYNQLTL